MQLIIQKPGIQAKQIAIELANRPLKTIERQVKDLKERGYIERKGSRKTGGYYSIHGKN